MYDTSSTIPPFIYYPNSNCTTLHPPSPCSPIISIVKCTRFHPPSHSSSTIPIVKCTTLHPPSPCSSTIPIVKCATLHPQSPLFIYLNSQMYDTSVTVTVIPLRPLLGLGTASLKQCLPSLSCPTLGHVKRGFNASYRSSEYRCKYSGFGCRPSV